MSRRTSLAVGAAALVGALTLSLVTSGGGPWRLVFEESFDTPASVGEFDGRYGQTWGSYPDGWPSTFGNGRYQPSRTVSVQNGLLDIWVHTNEAGPATAALLPRLPGYGQVYGKYEVRFRSDPVPGFKVAFLLWPDSERWPDDGEIDFPEGGLDDRITAFAHHAAPGGGQDGFPTEADFARWHVATIEWRPGVVRFLLDGEVVGESRTKVPSRSMHWVLQVETASDVAPDPAAQGHVQVDWVRAWALER